MELDRDRIFGYCIPKVKERWQKAGDSFPDFLNEFSPKTQFENEQYIRSILEGFQIQFQSVPFLPRKRNEWREKTLGMIESALGEENIIGVHHSMEQRDIGKIIKELSEFLRQVRKFAPELPIAGTGQAARNYIVYSMFKQINRVDSGFSRACFGYSMLYPFTDNYIDSPQRTDREKQKYNRLIRDEIEGKKVRPMSRHFVKTCQLLRAIEATYPRKTDPTASGLLLMMLDAQEDSLRQQNSETVLTARERLDISIYKGGISVLIDRFFVDKVLTEADLDFYFGFGFFLQLADDLQDISADSTMVNQTLFTADLEHTSEEKMVNKMLHFIRQITMEYEADNEVFKEFILQKCFQLVIFSVLQSRSYFSKDYHDALERFSPVSYCFLEDVALEKIEKQDIKIQRRYMKILDGLL